MNTNPFLTPNNNFQAFGFEHGVSALVFISIGFALIRWAQNKNNKKQDQVFVLLSVLLILTNVIWIGLQFLVDDFNYREDLPFHLCNVVGLFTIFLATTKKLWIYEVLLFWTMSAILLALVTPGIVDSFPHYHFMKYWFTHAGVMIFIFYATLVYEMRPTIKSVFKSFFALQIYAIVVYGINSILESNYFYLNAKPPVATLLDNFGDWPHYLIAIEIMLIPLFLLIYLPFYLGSKIKKQA